MESAKKWYAVYTRSKWEKKVAQLLHKKGIENYCPLNKVVRQWSDRLKTVEEPLFKSYVFVCVDDNESLSIKQTEGVINFVHWLGKPAVIKDDEIIAIQEFLGAHKNVMLERVGFKLQDKIRITDGPLAANEGFITDVKNKTVKVILSSLGYALVAELRKENVEIIVHSGVLREKHPIN